MLAYDRRPFIFHGQGTEQFRLWQAQSVAETIHVTTNQEAENRDYQCSAGFLFVLFIKEEICPGTQLLDGTCQN